MGFYLGGKVIPARDAAGHLEAFTAMAIAFCKPGQPCATDDELRFYCASGAVCAPNRDEFAKAQFLDFGGTEQGWQRVLTLVSGIREAVRTRDVSMFVR